MAVAAKLAAAVVGLEAAAAVGVGVAGRARRPKAAEKAKLAAFLAAKYGGNSKVGATASGGAASSSADADEVEIMGERTQVERDRRIATRGRLARPDD